MQITVAELIVRFLQRLDIECIFGVPGAHILPVYDQLQQSRIRSVLAKHEQGAAFMAGGYARASGKIGACIATAGPGATNLITGIANAYADQLPVLAITGETSTRFFGKGGLQESSGEGGSIDQTALFAGITRYHKLIERTEYLPTVLQQAVKQLRSESPGPVVLSLPFDVQKERVDAALLEQITFGAAGDPGGAHDVNVSPTAIARSVDLLRVAQRPLIIAGYGVMRAGAQAALKSLSERLNIPVTSSLKAKGVFDEHSALALGSLGVTSGGYALRYLEQEADLVLVLGAGFNERTSYAWDSQLLAGKKCLQVDSRRAQLEKVFRADLAVQADLHVYLTALDAAVAAQNVPAKAKIDIAAFTRALQAEAEAAGTTIFNHQFDHVRAFYAWLAQRFPDGLAMFDDNIVFAQNFYRFSSQDRYYPNTGVSSLGHAIPAAIGAGCTPQPPLFAVLGDGGFHMCAMELMTAVNYGIPLTIVLFNNSTMGLIRKNQHYLYASRFIDCDFINPDFAVLAKAFGIVHWRLDCEADLARLAAADFEQGINLIEIRLDQDAYPNYSVRR